MDYEEYDLYPPRGRLIYNLTIYNSHNVNIVNSEYTNITNTSYSRNINNVFVCMMGNQQVKYVWIEPECYNKILSRVYMPEYDLERVLILSGEILTSYNCYGEVIGERTEARSRIRIRRRIILEQEQFDVSILQCSFQGSVWKYALKARFQDNGILGG